ncbi:uncharacterized protein PHALS_13345 [Plasmopara halstedii]|uniref:Uncharacterized protein n=1 Tax=Plasmopara halstedii TaxID=4781 RepID=A0A0P1AQG5_PLAHL|nr:uncharacterized protein PHALS_13345 [Plasmopara halstedii]CEG43128.1 hypothetical protein PHALS_13345 [Plasmopara halstedii]|eukprot:XP_024579497.1 hypothetical protein PHALS_13345 [Plasmopara halstedii]
MPHLEEFFTHGNGAIACMGSSAADNTYHSQEKDGRIADKGILYLHGPQDACQTSLLLQFGFTQAKAGKNVVLIICGSAGASQNPVASDIVPITACSKCHLPVQTGEDNSIWSCIHIKYLRSSVELQHFLCSLHVVDNDTSVLLVNGFENYFTDPSHMGIVYHTLALLLEAQEYMKIATGLGITLVAGNTDAFLLRDRPLLRRWCRFLEIVPWCDDPNGFILREETEKYTQSGDAVATSQIQFRFRRPGDNTDGYFQLLNVQRRQL